MLQACTVLKRLGQAAVVTAFLYTARRFYRNWGATKEESRTRLPGDELIGGPAVQTTDAVWVDAPAAIIWPWLVQLGQDRGGLYSYDALENLAGLHFRSADKIHPEWQRLSAGDAVRLAPKGWMGLPDGVALKVAQIVPERSIVLRAASPQLPWDAIWSFHIVPHWQDCCRLLIRNRARMRYPGEVFGTELAGPLVALITRGMLLGIKRRVEAQQPSTDRPPQAS